ncbi:XRE family transcriptional regulator, partial [Fulvivirga sp. RKSG066]|uniref:helix-turn-helix domain-containing protein n=1 Tax=Fulvivirga aurantia TaxID=2529383 RepID=UPI0012BCCDD0
MNFIAKTITETRRVKGLTQEELAEKAKVNLRTIQRIENSESDPRGTTLNFICDALEIDISQLLSTENPDVRKSIGSIITNGVFLLILNLLLTAIIGFLTLDTNANINSIFAGFLVSVLTP